MAEYEGNLDLEADGFPTEEQLWDGKRVYAQDMDSAACSFAESYQTHQDWYPNEMEVFVMSEKDRVINKIIVNMQPIPEYSAGEHTQKPAG